MIAVSGIYDNGKIQLSEKPPVSKAQVIVIFPEDELNKKRFPPETARKVFEEFTGSINREIHEKSERIGALDEKYASSN